MAPQATGEKQQLPPERAPWYALHPRHLHFSKWTWRLLVVGLVIYFFYAYSVKPLWQFGWRTHLYCPEQFWPVKSAAGKQFHGGGWVTSRHILVYGAPGIRPYVVKQAADGMQSIVDELHLDLTVQLVPTPPDAAHSLAAATIHKSRFASQFDLDKFIAHRLDDRGMRYAEMVIVDAPFTDPSWAWGLTDFPSGTSVLQEQNTCHELGRHEGTHLLGYDRHDDFPYYVFGYPEAFLPSQRATLMMLLPKNSEQISPRARDAVLNFWHGLETKDRHYFK